MRNKYDSLWDRVCTAGDLSHRFLSGPDAKVTLSDLVTGSSLGDRLEELRGQSVFVLPICPRPISHLQQKSQKPTRLFTTMPRLTPVLWDLRVPPEVVPESFQATSNETDPTKPNGFFLPPARQVCPSWSSTHCPASVRRIALAATRDIRSFGAPFTIFGAMVACRFSCAPC